MLNVKAWPLTRKSELYLANTWIYFSYNSTKREMDKIFDLQSQRPKGVRNLAKGRPVAIFKYFMWIFKSFSVFPSMLNYISMQKSPRSVRNERPANSFISLCMYLNGINFQRSLLQHIRMILTLEEMYEK